jgi:hypothetical protein
MKISNRLTLILRWLAVIPMSLITNIIIYWLFGEAQSFFYDENSKYVIYVVPLISSFASGIAIISGGVWTAPKYKKETGLVLLVIVALMMGYGIITKLQRHEYFELSKDVLSVIGSVLGYLMAGKEDIIFEN